MAELAVEERAVAPAELEVAELEEAFRKLTTSAKAMVRVLR